MPKDYMTGQILCIQICLVNKVKEHIGALCGYLNIVIAVIFVIIAKAMHDNIKKLKDL